ncbi:Hypothetical protein, putative [Bodo saltans]|uniref:Uncharacterized protein n=1 Tax=Bodo saltans TaxID=75058 RepID=A0A0S4JNB7_BODSA|nr:Hypothetical protein, putative [Bodo saltans]|eukprot:CUG91386.1 Hypothetical protein, putative [Bodo saltans]
MIRFGKPLPRGVTVMDADPLASLSQKVAHRRDLVTPTVSSSHQRKHQLPPRASTSQQLPVTSTTVSGGGRSSAPNKLQPLRAATGSGAVNGPPPNTTSGIARMVLPVRNSGAVKYNEEIEAHAVANTTAEQLMVEAMLHGRLDRLHLLVSPVLPSRSDDSRVSPERRSPLRGEYVQLDGVNGSGEDAEEAAFGTAVNAIDVPLGSSRTQPLPNKTNEMVYGSKAADVPCLIPTRSQQRISKPLTPSQHQQRGTNNNNMIMATTTVIGQTTIDPPLSSRNIFAAQPLIHTALQQKQQHRAIGHQQSQQDVDTVGGPGRVTAPHNGSVEFNYDEHQHHQQQHNGGGQFWDSSEHGALHRHQEHHAGHHESYASSYPYMSPIGASYNNNGNNNSLASQQQQPQQHRRTHTFADHVATVRGGGAAAAAAVATPPAGSISPFPASTRVLHGSNSAPSQTAVQQQQHQVRADGGVDKHHNAFSGATNDNDADGYGEFVHYAVAVDGARGGQRLTVAKPEFSYLA